MTDAEANGPSDIAPRGGVHEGVKVAPGNQQSAQHVPQVPIQQYPNQNNQNYVGPRPVLRKSDSRTSISPRPPGPQGPTGQTLYPGSPSAQNSTLQNPSGSYPPPQSGNFRPPIPQQPRPPNFAPRPLNAPQRFPTPQHQQQPNQQPPARYGLYEHVPNPPPPGQEGNFRRAVNAVTDGQLRFTRPPQPQPQVSQPRNPGIFPQKSFPAPNYNAPHSGPPGDVLKKSHTLESDLSAGHSVGNLQNGAASKDASKAPVAFRGNQQTVDLIPPIQTPTRPQNVTQNSQNNKYEDIRSSSSLGFHHTDTDKDLDVSTLNGKSSSREDIVERSESRTGFLSRDHSSHSSMQKIDEDDDDAVVTPSRAPIHSSNSSLRSGRTTPLSNSNDNLSQQLKRMDSAEMKKPPTEIKTIPSPIYTTTTPKRNSIDNTSSKEMDIDPSVTQIIQKPQMRITPEPVRSQTLHTPHTPHIPHTPPTPHIPHTPQTPINLIPQENYSRSPSPGFARPADSPKPDATRITSAGSRNVASPYQENIQSPSSNQGMRSPHLESNKSSPTPRPGSVNSMGRRTPSARLRRPEGDNDSGVDESTQGNDRSFNGEQSSPRKTPNKMPASRLPGKCKTPVKMLQSPKSPDPSSAVPQSADKKKVPMNKVQVGAAPSPNIKTVKSKIGSFDNTSYKPGGGKIKVENRKIDFSKVQPRIAAKNDLYTPGGGDKKIQQQKLQWNAKSKIGSLENATYKPGGGDKKIESVKLDFKDKAKPKVGSKDNIKHTPGGGEIKSVEEEPMKKIENKKLELNVQSKIGSLDNVKHKPGGGDIKIFDDKDYLRQKSTGEQSVRSGSQSSLHSQPEPSEPVSDENLNQER